MSGFGFDTSFSSYRDDGCITFYGGFGTAFNAFTFNTNFGTGYSGFYAQHGPSGTLNNNFGTGCPSGFFSSFKYGNSGFNSSFCPAGFCASGFNAAAYFNSI